MKRIGGLLIVLVLAGLAGYLIGRPAPQDPPPRQLHLAVDCQPVGTLCTASDKRHRIALRLDSELGYLKPFSIEVEVGGFGPAAIEGITVTFTMTGMDMGLNRFRLQPVDTSGIPTRYQGQGMLPVCVTGRSDWQALVEVRTEDARYQARFDFNVTHR